MKMFVVLDPAGKVCGVVPGPEEVFMVLDRDGGTVWCWAGTEVLVVLEPAGKMCGVGPGKGEMFVVLNPA